MAQGEKISFVVFPDGKVDEKSLTISGERMAVQRCINAWLPERYFGSGVEGLFADRIWRQMQDKGFRAYTIQMVEGAPAIVETP